jgi:hypothetical protein
LPHDELIVRPKMTNFIQALPSQGSKHLPKLENGQRSNSFPSQVPRATEKIRAPAPWRDHPDGCRQALH